MTNLTKLTKYLSKPSLRVDTHAINSVCSFIGVEPKPGILLNIYSNLRVDIYIGVYDPDYDEWIDVSSEMIHFHSVWKFKKWLKKYYL